jgi:3-hydroxybutyrate dehydrogenase
VCGDCAVDTIDVEGTLRLDFINIALAHALVAFPFKSAYVAAKHGIAGFTKTVALELATQGITMNAIKKFVTIEQVAALASFLASEAAASTTGTVLPMDGGWTAQ